MLDKRFEQERDWLLARFESLPTTKTTISPSEWAEKKRYLPRSVTPKAGFYRFKHTPFLREIVDCFSPESPVREVAFRKPTQIGATVGVGENMIGYAIEHVKHVPIMLITATDKMAEKRMNSYIMPMLNHSQMMHLIASSDTSNNQKTGKTKDLLQWIGGGSLFVMGAQSPAKMRSESVQWLIRDELNSWPGSSKTDGGLLELSQSRTDAFVKDRKIFDISSPTLKDAPGIDQRVEQGDKRRYHVHCIGCNQPQTLKWFVTNKETGERAGIVWEMNADGTLDQESVRYACEFCGYEHRNEDLVYWYRDDGAHCYWEATKVPIHPNFRSYVLNALYSTLKPWHTCVQEYLQCWDVATNKPKNQQTAQVFWNNVLGRSYEILGAGLDRQVVSKHRRSEYKYGEVPNRFAMQATASKIHLLTCTVDVQHNHLKVAVIGWTRGERSFLIDYWTFGEAPRRKGQKITYIGDTTNPDDKSTWGRLDELLLSKTYTSDDGEVYGIKLCLVDSGAFTDTVYKYCLTFAHSVFPIKGQPMTAKSAVRYYWPFANKLGQQAFNIQVDLYKNDWSSLLSVQWDRLGLQPIGHFNVPVDCTDEHLKELTVEKRVEKKDLRGVVIGHEWHRPHLSENALWDLIVYARAAIDILANDVCIVQNKLDKVSMPHFWELIT